MEHLPWLVVHGDIVWEVLLPLGVVCGFLLLWPKVRLSAHRIAREHRSALDSPLDSLETVTDGQTVVLRGRLSLADDGETIRRFDDGEQAAVSTVCARPRAAVIASLPLAFTRSSPGLHLIVGETEVKLEDPVEALVGSREYHPGRSARWLPPKVKERLHRSHPRALEMLARKHPVMTSLAVGDIVIVRGKLHREPGDNTGTYREATARWALTGDPRPLLPSELAKPRLTAAAEKLPDVIGPWWPHLMRMGVGAIIGGIVPMVLLWILGAVFIGDHVYDLGWDGGSLDPDCTLSRPRRSVQIAASSPFHRERALTLLSRSESLVLDDVIMNESCYDQSLDMLTAVETLRGECGEQVSLNVRHGRFERALELTSNCDHPDAALWGVLALANLGRFERASELLATIEGARDFDVDFRTVLRIHLLARQWGQVAASARREAEETSLAVPSRVNLRCLAEHADFQGGDNAALARLEEVAGEVSTAYRRWPCELLRLDAVETEHRVGKTLHYDPGVDVTRVFSLLEVEGRATLPNLSWTWRPGQSGIETIIRANHFLLPFWYDGLEREVLAELERESLEPGPRPRGGVPAIARLRLRAALFHLYIGEHEAARAQLGKVLPGGLSGEGASDADICHDARAVLGRVELDAGEAEEAMAQLTKLRRGCGERREALATRCAELQESLRESDQPEPLGDEPRDLSPLHACRARLREVETINGRAEVLIALAQFQRGAGTEQLEALYTSGGHRSWRSLDAWSGATRGDTSALVSLMNTGIGARFLPTLAPRIEAEPERLLRTTGTMEYQPGRHLSFGRVDRVIDLTPGRQLYYPIGREDASQYRDLLPELERVALRRAVAAALSHGERTRAYDAAIVRIRDAMLVREVAVPLAILERI